MQQREAVIAERTAAPENKPVGFILIILIVIFQFADQYAEKMVLRSLSFPGLRNNRWSDPLYGILSDSRL